VVTVQQPQKRAREDEVNAKRRQPTLIHDRTYVSAMCTENIHYFCRYVRARAYAKKGKCDASGWGDTAPLFGGPKSGNMSPDKGGPTVV
jgi:hypothetical protein